ncbi:MAG: glycosyltransferase family 2 protein [Candidatus Acidiferrales bacterium]
MQVKTEEREAVRDTKRAPAGVTVVVPAYNEEGAIASQIKNVLGVMERSARPWELIVVDDGSTDATASQAEQTGARLIRLGRNRGYGAALKAGIAAAQHELIVITDADGTYPSEAIPALLEHAAHHDMVVGARIGENVAIPLARRPAKWVLGRLASYMAGQKIPDLNSGLRVMKKSLVEKFEHLLPSGFSFTTTITLALLCSEYSVYYHAIEYHKRVGQSKIRPGHAYQFLMLILRTIVYFNPLRFFLPLGAVFFAAGVAKFGYDITKMNLSESAVMGVLTGVIIWCVGLLADQISRMALFLKSK